jgi:hypothetical protein
MNKLTKEQRKEYFTLVKQYNNGWHLSDTDKRDLIWLNHLVMENCHQIHNDNMLNLI